MRENLYCKMRIKCIWVALILLIVVGCGTFTRTSTVSIFIEGWVKSPGVYRVTSFNVETVDHLVSLAGGLEMSGDERQVFRAKFVGDDETKNVIISEDKWKTPLRDLGVDTHRFKRLNIQQRMD
jgi:hypothetical protein